MRRNPTGVANQPNWPWLMKLITVYVSFFVLFFADWGSSWWEVSTQKTLTETKKTFNDIIKLTLPRIADRRAEQNLLDSVEHVVLRKQAELFSETENCIY